MNIGTKSILFGVHQFLIHPWFVAYAWYKLYSFPWKIQYWIAFFVHDLGYWGKPNMDGPEGETHVELGALIMHKLFDPRCLNCERTDKYKKYHWGKWYDFTLFHSRFYAKKMGAQYSKLCVADKYSFIVTPKWLYKIMCHLSGEINEYMHNAVTRRAEDYKTLGTDFCKENLTFNSWYDMLTKKMTKWCNDYKEIKEDKHTKYV